MITMHTMISGLIISVAAGAVLAGLAAIPFIARAMKKVRAGSDRVLGAMYEGGNRAGTIGWSPDSGVYPSAHAKQAAEASASLARGYAGPTDGPGMGVYLINQDRD